MSRAARPAASTARGLVALLVAVGVGVASAGAVAAETADGYWYFDNYDVASFHEQGIDGSGVKIAVIDSAIDPDAPFLADANITVNERAFCEAPEGESVPVPAVVEGGELDAHGTNVTGLIVGNGERGPEGIAPGAEVRFYGVGAGLDIEAGCAAGTGELYVPQLGTALRAALDDGADIVNISMGSGLGFAETLYVEQVTRALRQGVPIVVAVGNDRLQASDNISGLNGVIGVASIDRNGETPSDVTLDGEEVVEVHHAFERTDVVAPGVEIRTGGGANWDSPGNGYGTSYASPITVGNLALAMQANPEATPNQVLQLLIHNTGVETPHEPVFDPTGEVGYGVVDTISLLGDDATKYEDVNPFILEGPDEYPSAEDIRGEVSPTGEAELSVKPSASPVTPEPDPSVTPEPGEDESGFSLVWIVLGVIVALALITLIVVLLSRRRAQQGGDDRDK